MITTISINLGYIKSNRISSSKDTLTRIAEILGLTYSILTQLRELEKKLEEDLETRTDIEQERKELLILQALSHAVLDYYYRQASINNNSIKKLGSISVVLICRSIFAKEVIKFSNSSSVYSDINSFVFFI